MVEALELLDVERCMVFLIDDSCESVGILWSWWIECTEIQFKQGV